MQGHPYYYPSKGYPATIRTDAAEGEHFSHRHTLAGTKHGHGKNAPPPPYYHHVKAASVQCRPHSHRSRPGSQVHQRVSAAVEAISAHSGHAAAACGRRPQQHAVQAQKRLEF